MKCLPFPLTVNSSAFSPKEKGRVEEGRVGTKGCTEVNWMSITFCFSHLLGPFLVFPGASLHIFITILLIILLLLALATLTLCICCSNGCCQGFHLRPLESTDHYHTHTHTPPSILPPPPLSTSCCSFCCSGVRVAELPVNEAIASLMVLSTQSIAVHLPRHFPCLSFPILKLVEISVYGMEEGAT